MEKGIFIHFHVSFAEDDPWKSVGQTSTGSYSEKDRFTFAGQSSAGRSLLLLAVDALLQRDDDHHARSDEKGGRHDCQSDPGWFDRLD